MIAALAACLLLAAAPADDPAQKGSDEGWRPLFNGKNLEGWEHVGPGSMKVEDGLIRTEGGMGLLWYTKEKLGDCQIRVVFRTTDKSSNSGVFIRVADKPKDEWYAVHHGYEVQICDVQDPYHSTGAIYSLASAKEIAASPSGEWNTMIITLKGDLVKVNLNGKEVTDFDPSKPVPERTKDYEPERGPRPEKGYIGLQNHDDYDKSSHVEFKEVSVRPLAE